MSIHDIIKHSVEKNPLAMKEALEEELRSRIALAIEAKMMDDEDEEEEDDEDEDEDEEEDDEDEEEMSK